MRPSGAPMPKFFVPTMVQQGQRPNDRRGAGPGQQTQQSMQLIQQQVSVSNFVGLVLIYG